MYVFENALRNVLRNKGRYLLIGGVILAVIVVTVISLMINNTAGGIIDDYKSRFGAEVLIQPNVDKIREEAMAASTDGRVRIQMPSIEPGMYVDFGNSEYLKSSVYTASTGLVCDGLAAVAEDLGGGGGPVRMGMGGAAGGAAGSTAEGDDAEQQPMSYFMNLLGGQFQEFEDGSRQLADGRMPEALNECIVSADLAELNGISLGDSFEFAGELRSLDMETESETTAPIAYTLTVVGTYHDLTDEYAEGAMQNAYTNRRNEILTTYETVIQEMVSGMNGIRVSGTYYLQDPSMLDAFAAEVYAKGLPETFDVKTDEAAYKTIVSPVEGLKGISLTFMVVVLIFGAIIIALLASIAIRERKYEIGVLRAMGMKKRTVATGLWAEMLAVTILCTVVGLGAGALAAQPITDILLEGQVAAAEEAAAAQEVTAQGMGMGMRMLGGSPTQDAEPLSHLDLRLEPLTALQIAGIALLLASLAGLIASRRITKYEPIRILMERN